MPDTTNASPEARTASLRAAGSTSGRRLLPDEEIIFRRAQGEKLKPLAQAAGIRFQTLSAWLRRPEIAKQLETEKAMIKLERERARKKQAAQAKAARALKRVEKQMQEGPEPVVWDREGGERYDAYVRRAQAQGVQGKLLRSRRFKDPIRWS